ncbi:carbohydrate binding domain-containing protein [Paludibacterium yongneupense]|uniref:carbohydrate binding domain-containing protein n=1 Tax=Paludibacterium yongneupense TaxID=400061 RepID=UPI0004015715|nr:carbohydrate binding domain-containing protein [Paludibacterium yongneupense]
MTLRLRVLLCLFAACGAHAADAPLFPYHLPWDDASLNLSNLHAWNPAPAGRSGFVGVRNGHLYAEGRRLRLLGVNCVFGGALPEHDVAERIAARMARFGINAVRFHHMDTRPAPDGLLLADRLTLDPKALDRLDYFIAALKRVGIYSDLNLHVGRSYPGFAPWSDAQGRPQPQYWKGVDLFYPPMIAMQRDYARTLLSHRNPYTGHQYRDEPALALVEINNEDGLIREWQDGALDRMSEPYRSELRQRWNRWLSAHYRSTAELARAWSARDDVQGDERFDTGGNGWNLQVVEPARARQQTEGDGSLRVTVEATDSENWHVQLHQLRQSFAAGQPYTLRLRLRADRPLRVRLAAMQAHPPWQSLWQTAVDVDTRWRDYRFTFAPVAGDGVARFTLGGLGEQRSTLWLGMASLKTGGRLGLLAGESLEGSGVDIFARGDEGARSAQGQRDWLQFLWDTETEYWDGMRNFLRQTVGLRSLLIGTQVGYSPAPIQARMDVVDGHAYWQHPRFPGRPWDPADWSVANTPMAGIDGGGTLADLALRRMAGKPFVVTEYNHPAPGEFVAEGLPLLAAYAALQDWDGVFVFDYGAGDHDPGFIASYFDIQADPGKMSALPAAAALFRRGDVATPGSAGGALPSPAAMIEAMRAGNTMPAADQFGTARNEALRRPVALGSTPAGPRPLPVRAIGGQLVWGEDGRKTVVIDTPRSKGLVGAGLGRDVDAGGVGLRLLQARHNSGVLLATLMDGRDFSHPGRVLLTAIGSEENSGQRWLDEAHTTLGRQWGQAPVWVEGIAARIVLPVAAARVGAWALDERGQRRQALPVAGDHAHAVFETSPGYRALWYELEIR